MFKEFFLTKRYFSAADVLVFAVIGATIYGILATGSQWNANFKPITEIDLSLHSLPIYAFYSTMRALAAYLISLTITLIFGYWAAKSKTAERILVPMFDILQSVPVLGFLPGLMLAFTTLFPKTNTGLELVAIIMVVTSQAWNMIFSFYYSLKGLPEDYKEAADIMGLDRWRKLLKVELPYSAVGLAWNSIVSMANGWFFICTCEAFTLDLRDYRLPGLGSYMSMAIQQENTSAMIYGIMTMVFIIVILDFVIWRPVLSWVRKFRAESTEEDYVGEPLMLLALKESKLIRWITLNFRRLRQGKRKKKKKTPMTILTELPIVVQIKKSPLRAFLLKLATPIFWVIFLGLIIYGSVQLIHILATVPKDKWGELGVATSFTFLRVVIAVALSSLWAVPFGIWVGLSPRRTKIVQPIIQVMASFPAPMIYPLVLNVLFNVGFGLGISSIFLMMLGVQWYVLFNVLAGALRISQNLSDSLKLIPATLKERWKVLYLPSIFPALITGWITATGGAWNASIVTEFLSYNKETIHTPGLGSMINIATDKGDIPALAASLTMMIGIVVILNRTFWLKLYTYSENKYRLE